MARFRFRLQPVLDARRRTLDERQLALAAKQRERNAAQSELDALDAQRDAQRDLLLRDHTAFDVDALRATYAHLAYLDRSIEDQQIRVAACDAEVSRTQHKLVTAHTDVRVLETLKTRRHEAFTADEALVEQREVDDQNARRYGRVQHERENSA